jgi:hypothetical protein
VPPKGPSWSTLLGYQDHPSIAKGHSPFPRGLSKQKKYSFCSQFKPTLITTSNNGVHFTPSKCNDRIKGFITENEKICFWWHKNWGDNAAVHRQGNQGLEVLRWVSGTEHTSSHPREDETRRHPGECIFLGKLSRAPPPGRGSREKLQPPRHERSAAPPPPLPVSMANVNSSLRHRRGAVRVRAWGRGRRRAPLPGLRSLPRPAKQGWARGRRAAFAPGQGQCLPVRGRGNRWALVAAWAQAAH